VDIEKKNTVKLQLSVKNFPRDLINGDFTRFRHSDEVVQKGGPGNEVSQIIPDRLGSSQDPDKLTASRIHDI